MALNLIVLKLLFVCFFEIQFWRRTIHCAATRKSGFLASFYRKSSPFGLRHSRLFADSCRHDYATEANSCKLQFPFEKFEIDSNPSNAFESKPIVERSPKADVFVF